MSIYKVNLEITRYLKDRSRTYYQEYFVSADNEIDALCEIICHVCSITKDKILYTIPLRANVELYK